MLSYPELLLLNRLQTLFQQILMYLYKDVPISILKTVSQPRNDRMCSYISYAFAYSCDNPTSHKFEIRPTLNIIFLKKKEGKIIKFNIIYIHCTFVA